MLSVDTSYSCTPRCDSHTGMSIGLSLLAALITTAALVVLANRGYISPTVAYCTAPALGATFILIGAAVALIRKNTHTLVEISQLIETQKEVTLEKDIIFHPPDLTHPYAYYTVTLNMGTLRISGVEILAREIPNDEGITNILFAYGGKRYVKQTQVLFSFWNPTLIRNAVRNAFTQWDEDLATWSGKKYLSKEKYQILMQEGNCAEFFQKVSTLDIDDTGSSHGMLFEIPGFISLEQKGSQVNFQKKEECPQDLCEGLKDHPAVIKKLSAKEWHWNLPRDLNFIEVLSSSGKSKYPLAAYANPPLTLSEAPAKRNEAPPITDDYKIFVIGLFEQMRTQKMLLFSPNEACPYKHYTMTCDFEGYSVKFFYYKEAGSFKLDHRLLS